jgi:hypothetical protein
MAEPDTSLMITPSAFNMSWTDDVVGAPNERELAAAVGY